MAFARDAVVKGLMQCDKLIQSAKEGDHHTIPFVMYMHYIISSHHMI